MEMAPNEVEKFFKSFKETKMIRRVYMEKVPTADFDVYLEKVPASLSGGDSIYANDVTIFSLLWPTEDECPRCEDYGHQEEHCWMTKRQAQERRVERERRQSARPQDPSQAKAQKEAEQKQKLPQQQKQEPANTSEGTGASAASSAKKAPGKATGAPKKTGQAMYRVKNDAPSPASSLTDNNPSTPTTNMDNKEQEKEKVSKFSMFDSDSDESSDEKKKKKEEKSETTEKIEKDKISEAENAKKTGAPKSSVLTKLENIKATRKVPGSPKPNMLKPPSRSTEEWDGAQESRYV
jgi:hypothetical protein